MHIIRLRGPWEVVNPESGATCRVHWPLTLRAIPESLAASRLTLRRNFNRPTGMEPHESVVLRVCSSVRLAAVGLNQTALPVCTPSDTVDVTRLLRPHNALIIQLRMDPTATVDPAQSMLDVQLEISSQGSSGVDRSVI